jgi:hypothetical protein
LNRTIAVGAWAVIRGLGEVYVINKHMHKHGGVVVRFNRETESTDGFCMRGYHGSWQLNLMTGVAKKNYFSIPAKIDWNAPQAPAGEFIACGMRFVSISRHCLHILPLKPGARVERITLNGLSVGWIDLHVAGKLRTVYPSDRLDSGL